MQNPRYYRLAPTLLSILLAGRLANAQSPAPGPPDATILDQLGARQAGHLTLDCSQRQAKRCRQLAERVLHVRMQQEHGKYLRKVPGPKDGQQRGRITTHR